VFDELLSEPGVTEGTGFGKRRMREWVVVEPGAHDWDALARDALALVRA
jgi:hypothetical protein